MTFKVVTKVSFIFISFENIKNYIDFEKIIYNICIALIIFFMLLMFFISKDFWIFIFKFNIYKFYASDAFFLSKHHYSFF